MTSNKPYLIRALYDWIVDNHLTPHLLVDTSGDDLSVPVDFVEDDRIVLNISPSAVRDLDLSNDYIKFKARFSGQSMNVYFPCSAVQAIYARENGRGMIFPEEEEFDDSGTAESENEETADEKKKKPHLTIIK